jgi:hypothetical protein
LRTQNLKQQHYGFMAWRDIDKMSWVESTKKKRKNSHHLKIKSDLFGKTILKTDSRELCRDNIKWMKLTWREELESDFCGACIPS